MCVRPHVTAEYIQVRNRGQQGGEEGPVRNRGQQGGEEGPARRGEVGPVRNRG